MIVIDTDHLSIFMDERDARHAALTARMAAAAGPVACSIVNVEEVLRGWLALIHRERNARRHIHPYLRLAKFITVMGDWEIVPFDERAAEEFMALRSRRIRIGTMDLKIASNAIVNGATLVTANIRDFSQVPGLRCESWLEFKSA